MTIEISFLIKMFVFLLIFVFIHFVGAHESKSLQILHELNTDFGMELNVFVDFGNLESLYLLKNLDTPRIQLTSQSAESWDFQIRGIFTERSLVLVRLGDSGLDPRVASLLPHLVDKVHELHFVFLSMQEPLFPKDDLYTYCYKQGFVNVLLIGAGIMYSYLPYPYIQPIKLSNISEYLNRERIIRNFRGFPIRTLRSTLAPRDFEYLNDRNELVRGGYLFAAVKEFANRYNATLDSVIMPNVTEYAAYVAVEEMLIAKRIDIVCYFRALSWNVAYTAPLSIIAEYLMIPQVRPISSFLYYSRPFSWSLWVVVALTVLYGSLMLYLSSGRARNEIGECLLYSFSHILYSCHQAIRIGGWRDTVIHVILTIAGFILTNVYLATLSSILTSGLFEKEYNTFEDLSNAPYPNLHDEFYRMELQSKTFLPESFRQKSITLNITLLTAYRDGLNKNYIYLLYEDRLELVLMQQYLLKTPRFYKLRQEVGYALESYCVSNSLPYLKMTSEFMRRLQEHGINIKFKADAFRELIQLGMYTLMRDDEPPTKAFDLQYYYFAFGLWAVGLVLALLVLSIELVKWRYHKTRARK
ncbi:uncharacterized protein LOC108101788 [Drosophila ficusphila]|uniref:uncharacterized protein LOC108101788 n=1 Tax=Drosophila ficusphila TaxID=30025 RepID=UPI0007E78E64|nr:uncharacterized protein LOC108101788 [Drosophila ficusphila]